MRSDELINQVATAIAQAAYPDVHPDFTDAGWKRMALAAIKAAGTHGIADDSTAFPFLALARRLGVPYEVVLSTADDIERGIDRAMTKLWQYPDASEFVSHEMMDEFLRAVFSETWEQETRVTYEGIADLVAWERRRRSAARRQQAFNEPVPTERSHE